MECKVRSRRGNREAEAEAEQEKNKKSIKKDFSSLLFSSPLPQSHFLSSSLLLPWMFYKHVLNMVSGLKDVALNEELSVINSGTMKTILCGNCSFYSFETYYTTRSIVFVGTTWKLNVENTTIWTKTFVKCILCFEPRKRGRSDSQRRGERERGKEGSEE
jgi:hypothetical protein